MKGDWATFGWRLLAAEIAGLLVSGKAALIAWGIAALETNPYPAWRAGLLTYLIFLAVWNGLMIMFCWIFHPSA